MTRAMRFLFIHKNFPAQFGAFGLWLQEQGHDVIFATEREDIPKTALKVARYAPHRDPTPNVHHYIAGTEAAIIASQGFVRLAIGLRDQGYVPDVVMAHSGWGGGSFVKDIWPETAYVPYLEWHYQWPPVDQTVHDPQDDNTLDKAMRARARNLPFYLDLASADIGLCPTQFQADQFPDWIRPKLTVSPDGFDTTLASPGPRDPALLAELGIPSDAEILTWVTRGMEPARGFPEMMAALSALQQTRPNLHAIIVGDDRVAYGAKTGQSWKDRMLAELPFDAARLHFQGLVSKRRMIDVIRAGDVHLYLTAPFVLSWSCLEAMSCGALLVAADCAPVREFVDHDRHGLLTQMTDHAQLVATLTRALDHGPDLALLRTAARARILQDLDAHTIAFPKRLALLESLTRT